MQLHDFSLLKEDEDSYHLKHPSGKKLVVSKKGLTGKAHGAISMLKKPQHLDEGGSVQPQSYDIEGQQFSVPVPSKDGMSGVSSDWTPDPSVPTPQPASIPEPASDASAAGAVSGLAAGLPPAANPDPLVQKGLDTEDLLNKQEGDLKDLASAEGAEGSQKAKAYDEFIQRQAAMPTPQEIVASYKAKDDALMQAYSNDKLDPNRYLHSMSTGNRVAAGIGMLLSGMGSATTGQPNYAMENINNAINRDMEAQKNDQSKAMNLWKMNREALGNDLSANLATQNQMWTGVQAKVLKAGAMAQGPIAKFKMQEMVNQIEQQKIQNRMKLGLLHQGAGGGVSQADPAQLVSSMVPQDQQKQVYTEIGQAQAAVKNRQALLDNFEKANHENTIIGRAGRLGFTPPSIKSLNALADPLIHDNEGRINELEQQHVQALWPQPGDAPATVKAKRQSLESFIDHKTAGVTAKGNGIDLAHFASTNAQPSPVTATKNGVLYQKVAGGWKRVGP